MIIDVHHHFIPMQYFDEIDTLLPPDIEAVWKNGRVAGRDTATGTISAPAIDPFFWSNIDEQLRIMDAAGVDHAILSSACYQDWMTIPAARVINDATAEVVAKRPDRFSGMISVPPDGGDAMEEEISRARDLGLCALNMTTTHRGRYPDNVAFRRFLAVAADARLPVFVHPSWSGPLPGMDKWALDRTIGKPTDMTLGIANLMYNGTFTDLPDLQMCFGHLGGLLPIAIRRLFFAAQGYLNVPDHDYPDLLKRVFVDTAPAMWQSSLEVELTARIIGSSQVMLGSDYPLGNPETIVALAVDHVRNAAIPDEAKKRIFSTNAVELFRLHHLCADAPEGGSAANSEHGCSCC